MNLELKNIKHSKSLSEETPAYTATLYLDGKKVADIRNDGRGGPDVVHWIEREYAESVRAFFANVLNKDVAGYRFDQALELWCHTTINLLDSLKTVKRAMKTKIVGLIGDNICEWKVDPSRLPAVREKLEAQNPGVVVLNGKSDSEILTLLAA